MRLSEVRNLGFRTDFMVLGPDAVFTDLDVGLLIRCPSNPSYFWGNCLLTRRPPAPDQVGEIIRCFREAMGGVPEVRHIAIGWDEPVDDDATIAAFEARGFKAERGVVLTSSAPVPGHAAGLEIRAPNSSTEWEALLQMQVASSELDLPRSVQLAYQRDRNAQIRRSISEGRGLWRCAWIEGQVAGSMGLYAADGLGRFQSVQTHPAFRRRGVCAALLHATAAAGRRTLGAERLVIVADAGAVAEGIYRRRGFEFSAPTHGVCLYPPVD